MIRTAYLRGREQAIKDAGIKDLAAAASLAASLGLGAGAAHANPPALLRAPAEAALQRHAPRLALPAEAPMHPALNFSSMSELPQRASKEFQLGRGADGYVWENNPLKSTWLKPATQALERGISSLPK